MKKGGKKNMKKTFVGVIFVTIIFLFLPVSTFAFENVPIKSSQSALEVTVEVTGDGRIFHIMTYISNVGDEQLTVSILGMPGGGFEIHNIEEMVYYTPKFYFMIEWALTLDPGQTKKMYSEIWKGVDDYGNKLPSGDYSVKGFVRAEDGDIFSEPVNIHLTKAKITNILQLLNHFPLIERLFSYLII